jgi:hypothetical protein
VTEDQGSAWPVVLLDRAVFVTYGSAAVQPEDVDEDWEIGDEWRGQVNGLCGAAVHGTMALTTGRHTDDVEFVVELHHVEPPLGDAWEDVVEVSFAATSSEMVLRGLMSDAWPISLPVGDYRVRYCGQKMDQGHDGEPVDSYLLQFWPGKPGPDRVVRQTSSIAAYWHREHPAPALSPDDLADRVALRDREAERLEQEEAIEYERYVIQNRWGGRVPNERLRAASETSNPVDQLDRDLVFALSEVDDETQMAVAVWAAERACEVAGLAGHPALAAMLAAVRSGDHLPAPFDDHQRVSDLLNSEPFSS